MNKVYYKEINIARSIGIIMVVFFHSIGPMTNSIMYIRNICNIIQMPLFFFISGLVAYRINKLNSSKQYYELLKSKFKRLLIPYLTLGILMFIPKLLLNKFAEIKLNPNEFLTELLMLGNNPVTFLWFLYVLFLIFLIYSIPIKKSPVITLIINFLIYIIFNQLGISIEVFKISTIIYYSNYFILGYICIRNYGNIRDKIRNSINKFTILFVIYIFLCPLFTQKSIIISMFNSLFGLISVLLISIYLSEHKIGRILEYIGQYSYDIYLLSWFGQNIIRLPLQILGINIYTYICFTGMFIGGLSVMFLSKYIFRKNRFINKYILGNS